MANQVNIFQELRERTSKAHGLLPAEKRAMFWFRDYATSLNRWQVMNKGTTFSQLKDETFTKELVGSPSPGFLYYYMYDPKWKNELPYYDLFPFTLVLNVYADRFLGLNFHYLDYYHRAIFFDALYPLREGRPSRPDTRDIRMRMKVTYDILKSASQYKYFKPCIKMYLKKHVQTPFMKVGAKEWDVALFLPVEMFKKKSKTFVWARSKEMF
jgi:hypothetical protein